MKKNLGKIFLFLSLLLLLDAQAKQLADYKIYANKKSSYVNEPIEITFVAQQLAHKNIMFFLIKPKKNDAYHIKLLTKSTKDNGQHNTTATFKYIIFPLREGDISIDFDFSVKVATKDSLVQAYVTDHDEGSGIEGEISKVVVSPLTLKIKKLLHHVDLIGDYTLESKIDVKSIKPYESTNLVFTLQGTGNVNRINLLKKIKDVTLFSDINSVDNLLTKDGYKIKREYIYALNAKKDFMIPAMTLQAYSPKRDTFYTLKTTPYMIKVKKINPATLLDTEEKPQSIGVIDFKNLQHYFIYLLIFLFGYITAKLTNTRYKIKGEKKFQDIQKSKDSLELILILLNNYKEREINRFVSDLESIKYNQSNKSFSEVKKLILKAFSR